MSDVLSQLMQKHRNQLRDEWPWVWLYEAEVPSSPVTRIRLTNLLSDLQYGMDSNGDPITYTRFPIVHGGIEKSSNGDVQTMGITVCNISMEISRLIEQYDGLDGAPVVVRYVNMADLGNPKAQLEERGEIRGVRVRSRIVSFTLSAASLYRMRIPNHRYVSTICGVDNFGDADCGYIIPPSPGDTVGTGFSSCARRRTDCALRGDDEEARGLVKKHPRRWGAFPGMPRQLGGI